MPETGKITKREAPEDKLRRLMLAAADVSEFASRVINDETLEAAKSIAPGDSFEAMTRLERAFNEVRDVLSIHVHELIHDEFFVDSIRDDFWELEKDRAGLTSEHNYNQSEAVTKQENKKQSPGQGQPEQEPRAEVDLSRETLASPARMAPEERERLILGEFKGRAEKDPRGAIQWLYGVVRAAEAELPPEHRPTLGIREAARRISEARGISLSHSQLRRYFDDSNVRIGSLGPDGEPRFSPAECDAFLPPPPKKVGRPRKPT